MTSNITTIANDIGESVTTNVGEISNLGISSEKNNAKSKEEEEEHINATDVEEKMKQISLEHEQKLMRVKEQLDRKEGVIGSLEEQLKDSMNSLSDKKKKNKILRDTVRQAEKKEKELNAR